MLTPDEAWSFANHWISAWNSHDLDAILSHYDDSVELTSPVGTLGVLALLYLAVGWGAGRLCGRGEVRGLVPPVLLCVIAEVAVEVGAAFVQLMLSHPLDFGDVVRTLLASAILTGLIAAPVVAIARWALGAPYVVEPFSMPGDR